MTDEWQERGAKEGLEFAILTDEITKAWSDKSVKQYKKLNYTSRPGLEVIGLEVIFFIKKTNLSVCFFLICKQ